jgi:ABC-2 type transport system permease protein
VSAERARMPQRELIGVAAGLRLALLRGALRGGPGSTARRFGLAIGALFGAGMAIGAFVALAAARGHGRLPQDLAVLLFTVLVTGWVVLPILTFGSDDLLDPARLALLPLTTVQFITVMGVGAVIGVAPVATAVAALGLLPATANGPAEGLVALLSVVLLLALCISASRACTSALSGLLRSRRGRDVGVALTAVVALGFQLVNPFVQVALRNGGVGQDVLAGLADPLRWTPPGLLATAASRPWPLAIGSLLVNVLVIGLLLLIWERSVRRSLERAEISGSSRRRSTSLEPRRVPVLTGRAGAVMAKDLRYLMREPRRLVTALTGALLPVLAVVLGPVAVTGARPPAGLVFAVCGIGMLSGLSGANRFGLDGTATWVLISSATDSRDARRDLLGSDVAAAVITVPVILVIGGVLAVVTGGWEYLAPALGLALALFAVSLGAADVLSVRAPFAVPQSQNAFSGGGTGQGCTAGLLTMVAMFVQFAVCLPLLALLITGLVTGAPAWGIAVLLVGPPYGFVIGALARRSAARHWAERGPEVLQVLSAAR